MRAYPGRSGRREQHVAEFKTTVQGLLALRDGLSALGVTPSWSGSLGSNGRKPSRSHHVRARAFSAVRMTTRPAAFSFNSTAVARRGDATWSSQLNLRSRRSARASRSLTSAGCVRSR